MAVDAAAESSLWADCLLPEDERDRSAVFSPLGEARYALGLETIYEGYLLHFGRPRLFTPADLDTAILLGDYLYAHGLVRIEKAGGVDAVAAMADLIATCAALRAARSPGDGQAWVDAARRLGGDPADAEVVYALARHYVRVVP
jgi:hypothetical protein